MIQNLRHPVSWYGRDFDSPYLNQYVEPTFRVPRSNHQYHTSGILRLKIGNNLEEFGLFKTMTVFGDYDFDVRRTGGCLSLISSSGSFVSLSETVLGACNGKSDCGSLNRKINKAAFRKRDENGFSLGHVFGGTNPSYLGVYPTCRVSTTFASPVCTHTRSPPCAWALPNPTSFIGVLTRVPA